MGQTAAPASWARAAAAHLIVEDLSLPSPEPEDVHHLQAVLRLRPGQPVSVTDGRGGWRPCRWAPGGKLEPDGEPVLTDRPGPALCVGFCPVKGERSEWAVQKLAELGVERIVVLRAERSVVRWEPARAAAHLGRLRRIARQALMQSRGLWMPTVEGPVGCEQLAAEPGAALADPNGGPPPPGLLCVLVGPEGGWSERELGLGSLGPVQLPGQVLRTETAAVAAGVILVALRAGLVGHLGTRP